MAGTAISVEVAYGTVAKAMTAGTDHSARPADMKRSRFDDRPSAGDQEGSLDQRRYSNLDPVFRTTVIRVGLGLGAECRSSNSIGGK